MKTHRYKVQRSGFGLFLGIAAETTRLTNLPTRGAPISKRTWMDASEVNNAFHGNRLTLNEHEVAFGGTVRRGGDGPLGSGDGPHRRHLRR
jgi:hypothetical protein